MQEPFTWFNQPSHWRQLDGDLAVTTDYRADFWRKTEYGFIRDNGHFAHAFCIMQAPRSRQLPDRMLVRIEHVWLRAVEQHDLAALGCILADEFEEADFAGSLIDRSAMLARAEAGQRSHRISGLACARVRRFRVCPWSGRDQE